MPILCKPAVQVPENIITLQQTLDLCREIHANHPKLDVALRRLPIRAYKSVTCFNQSRRLSSTPASRFAIVSMSDKLRPECRPSCAKKPLTMPKSASARSTPSSMSPAQDSRCPMTAFLINTMGFRHDTKQIPIAQLGCAGGGSAINRAFELCSADPDANVLIVAASSALYVISRRWHRTCSRTGYSAMRSPPPSCAGKAALAQTWSARPPVVPNTEDWISYSVRSTGFHFQLDKRGSRHDGAHRSGSKKAVSRARLGRCRRTSYIIHAGGPRFWTISRTTYAWTLRSLPIAARR